LPVRCLRPVATGAGCAEQVRGAPTERIIIEHEGHTAGEIVTSTISKVQKGLDRLYAYQHDDGGWGWWKDDKMIRL
jgi:hypothetical protein